MLLQEVIGWYKLRRNSAMQMSMREHAIHRHLARWLQKDDLDVAAVLFMLCVSQSPTNPALYICDHQYMIVSDRQDTASVVATFQPHTYRLIMLLLARRMPAWTAKMKTELN